MKSREFDKEAVAYFNEHYDFTRCQRPNGSHYGTGGQCRQGSQVGPKEKAEGYKPRSKSGGGSKAVQGGFGGSVGTAETIEKMETRLAKAKETGDANRIKNAEASLKEAKGNKAFMDSLQKEMPSNTEVKVGFEGVTTKTNVGKHVVETQFRPDEGFHFTVNGSSSKGGANAVTDRREQIAVARSVQNVFDAHVKALPTGGVIQTKAWTTDGEGASRQKAYERMGFSKAEPGKWIYAQKTSSGSMVPATKGQFEDAEGMMRFAEKKEKTDSMTALWTIAIFGAGGKNN